MTPPKRAYRQHRLPAKLNYREERLLGALERIAKWDIPPAVHRYLLSVESERDYMQYVAAGAIADVKEGLKSHV